MKHVQSEPAHLFIYSCDFCLHVALKDEFLDQRGLNEARQPCAAVNEPTTSSLPERPPQRHTAPCAQHNMSEAGLRALTKQVLPLLFAALQPSSSVIWAGVATGREDCLCLHDEMTDFFDAFIEAH